MIENVRGIYQEYPKQFWLLMGATFVDLVGKFLILPFFSLYFTEKFNVTLTQVGMIYAIWALTSILGQALGGVLADRIGRKLIVIAGLVISALSSLAFAFVADFETIYLTAALGGLFSSAAGPARQAMVADLLHKDQLTEGYSIMRVVSNVAFAMGPAIGGMLAGVSYVLLFIIDVVTSIITAIIIALFMIETQKQSIAQKTSQLSIGQVFQGYALVLRNKILLAVLFLTGIVFLVYQQWYFSVPVFMRNVHSMPTYYYGSMMSAAGLLVVLVQFPLTRKLRRHSSLTMMVGGSLLFALGFGMFSFVTGYAMFMLAFIIITVGEMIFFPATHAIVGTLAPEDMRGRYMAVSGIAWTFPNMVGPMLGGFLLDKFEPALIWYLAAFVCIIGAVGISALQSRLPDSNPIA